jgi:uncharacterized protein YjdB
VTITATAVDGSGIIGTSIVNVIVPNIPVTGVTLQDYAAIPIGSTYQLTPEISPSDATDKSVTWAVSNAAVASIDATGLVTGVSAGTITVTVTTVDGGFTDTCVVYVYETTPADPSGDIIPVQPELPPGTPAGIVSAEPIILIPADSRDISLETDMLDSLLSDFSSNDFHVNKDGIITIKDWIAKEIAERELNIGYADVITVPVFEAVFTPAGSIVALGFRMKGSVLMVDNLVDRPENVRLLMALSSTSGKFFNYVGTAPDFADKTFTILDSTGSIYTGIFDPDATYTLLFFIKDGNEFDLDKQVDEALWGIMAIVGVPPMNVAISPNNTSLPAGASYDIKPTLVFAPPIGDNKKVTWSSSNQAVATVSADGILAAAAAGTAIITVQTEHGGHQATLNVTVTP